VNTPSAVLLVPPARHRAALLTDGAPVTVLDGPHRGLSGFYVVDTVRAGCGVLIYREDGLVRQRLLAADTRVGLRLALYGQVVREVEPYLNRYGEGARILHAVGQLLDTAGPTENAAAFLRANACGGTIVLLDAAGQELPERVFLSRNQRSVLALIADRTEANNPLTSRAIADVLSLPFGDLAHALSILLEHEFVRRGDQAEPWRVTSAGLTWLGRTP